ncbi:unnamed protein product [Arabis nemorensis]|uniref:Uncharacterized protein n=1 Tax=Arabis nemorensis TaxID=586526 RepID=A0A565CGH2_9BRAS|nr:unnamed protein product [Arabis nemorensis]
MEDVNAGDENWRDKGIEGLAVKLTRFKGPLLPKAVAARKEKALELGNGDCKVWIGMMGKKKSHESSPSPRSRPRRRLHRRSSPSLTASGHSFGWELKVFSFPDNQT